MKYLKTIGVVLLALLALYGVYRLFATHTVLATGIGQCPTSSCSTWSGGGFFALSNQGDTFSAGPVTPNFSIGGTQGLLYSGGGETLGGGVFSTTSQTTGLTLQANAFYATSTTGNIENASYNMLSIMPMVTNDGITLPASSTLATPFLANAGDVSDIWIFNATTTNSFSPNILLTAGTGTTFLVGSSTPVSGGTTVMATSSTYILGYSQAHKFEFVRLPTTNIEIIAY